MSIGYEQLCAKNVHQSVRQASFFERNRGPQLSALSKSYVTDSRRKELFSRKLRSRVDPPRDPTPAAAPWYRMLFCNEGVSHQRPSNSVQATSASRTPPWLPSDI